MTQNDDHRAIDGNTEIVRVSDSDAGVCGTGGLAIGNGDAHDEVNGGSVNEDRGSVSAGAHSGSGDSGGGVHVDSHIPRFDTSVSGVVDMNGQESVEIFEQYFDDTVIDHILHHVNLYGNQYVN